VRRRRAAAALAAVAIAIVAVAAAGCASPATVSSTPFDPVPLETAVGGPEGSWATIPMGQSGDPNNTFWQLFYRPAGATGWVDDVARTGTATNGGLVVAGNQTGLVVGVRPSQNLTFSPIGRATSGDRSWAGGVLPGGLAPYPQALAVAPDGKVAALLGTRAPAPSGGPQEVVWGGDPGLSDWTTAIPSAQLAAATQACGLSGITALAFPGPDLVLGGACRHPGVSGIYSVDTGRATSIGPALPAGARAQVVSLAAPPSGALAALLEVVGGGQRYLLVATRAPDGTDWHQSPPRPLAASDQLLSVAADGAAFVVLLSSGLYTASAGWQRWPDPPTGTAAVAPLTGGDLSALVADGATLHGWDLTAGSPAWAETQTLNVPILYGASS
jgi:hypothetical protein